MKLTSAHQCVHPLLLYYLWKVQCVILLIICLYVHSHPRMEASASFLHHPSTALQLVRTTIDPLTPLIKGEGAEDGSGRHVPFACSTRLVKQ